MLTLITSVGLKTTLYIYISIFLNLVTQNLKVRQYVDFFVVRWPCTVHTLTIIVINLSPSKEFIIEIKTCVNVGTVQLDIFFIWHVEVFTCEDFGVLGPHRKIKPTLVQIVQKQDNFGFFGTKEMIRIRFCLRSSVIPPVASSEISLGKAEILWSNSHHIQQSHSVWKYA